LLISLTWLRDFVDLPADLDPRALAERFTTTTAEVEGVEHVVCAAAGLVAAEIQSVQRRPGEPASHAVRVGTGGAAFDTVTVAENLKPGDRVIFAPPGATLPGVGTVTEKALVSGATSAGMIVDGATLGLPTVGQRAVWLPPDTPAGELIDLSLFDDWIIEIDNKSITNRPDLWGHYGIARELAAMLKRPLKPYPVVSLAELTAPDLPEVPITIDDPGKCPRYSALRFTGVKPRPSPLWMQARLAHVGLRPIDILVDLTNYVMADLGQPMHAFDASGLDRIEVALAAPGETFITLDGVSRVMPEGTLMIQSNRRSVAIAGIMGGAETEVKAATTDLLLESANFEPATIRRAATAMGHRTDASARFEKSLDPANTVLAIQRFVHLARPELPGMRLTSRLSDCYPAPPPPVVIGVDPAFVSGYIGRPVGADEIREILEPLGFQVAPREGGLEVRVPGFRATKDVTIEADVIEEVARFIGYGSIAPVLPTVTVRYAEPDAMALLCRKTLALLTGGMSYAEVHRYVWFDDDWLRRLGFEPGETVNLRNPAAASMARLRTTLVPGLLAAVDLNRHHADRFELVEIGSVFPPAAARQDGDVGEYRHLGLVRVAPGRKPAVEDELLARLKTDVETWAMQVLEAGVRFAAADRPAGPWEQMAKTALVRIDGRPVGRLTAVPPACKRAIDEHLAAWSIALAELNLSAVVGRPVVEKKLVPVPVFPHVEVDFSLLAPAEHRYDRIEPALAAFDHPLLRRLAFVDSFEGGSVPAGQRSFTFRATLADPRRTLTEQDVQVFRTCFIEHARKQGLTLRT
jgi:phenylalanyl-tRNA synthetase beta chain